MSDDELDLVQAMADLQNQLETQARAMKLMADFIHRADVSFEGHVRHNVQNWNQSVDLMPDHLSDQKEKLYKQNLKILELLKVKQ